MSRAVLAWHFAPADMRCAHDGRRIRVGQTLAVTGTPILCEHGLHASVRVLDALGYAPNRTRLCRVRVGGDVVTGSDKIAGTRRTVVWSLTERQTDRILRRFACDVAEGALRAERSAGREPDPRSWAAIEVARRHAVGRATDEELDAARAAAWDAARAAAWAAASAAAWAAQNRLLARLATAEHRRQP